MGSGTDTIHSDVVELAPVVRRVIAARVADPHVVNDLVQETLTRVLSVRSRLTPEAVLPYGIATARNLLISMGRSQGREQRHLHRLIDLSEPPSPTEEVLRREEASAVAAALDTLPDRDRRTLLSHEVQGVGTAALADTLESTPGAVAVSLARSRAKLRVEYLLALHKVQLPSLHCRRVLLALSAADRRRQLALGASEHLLDCPTCTDLSRPLLRGRVPAVAALLPLGLARLAGRLQAAVRDHPAGSLTVAGLIAMVVLAASATSVGVGVDTPGASSPPPQASARAGPTTPSAGTLALDEAAIGALSASDNLRSREGERVTAESVRVQSVVADEGFWIGDPSARVFVVNRSPGESPQRVRAGSRISFRGSVVAHGDRLPGRLGVRPDQGAQQLRRQGAHIAIEDLTLD